MPFFNRLFGRNTSQIASLGALLQLEKEFEGKEWAFRGIPGSRQEGVALKDLQTTLEKVAAQFKVEDVPWLEKTLIIEFVRRYHLYHVATPPRPGDTLEWLALMAHHGAPTRFLDFTYSLPVAAFFALERVANSLSGDTATIWAVDKTWLTRTVQQLYGPEVEKDLKPTLSPETGMPSEGYFFASNHCPSLHLLVDSG